MYSFLADLRYAFRQMRNAPAFAAVVVALIGIGIAANATIFTLVDTLLLRKLPVRNPEELVRIVDHHPPIPDSSYFSHQFCQFLQVQSTSFSSVIGQAELNTTINVGGTTDFASVGLVTDNYFEMLGVKPALGGLFGGAATVVLSDRYWRKKFNQDPAVAGRVIQLNGHPFTIAGVTAPDFHGTTVELNPDLRALATAARQLIDSDPSDQPRPYWGPSWEGRLSYELVARLKPGVSVERALSESSSLFESSDREFARLYNVPIENLGLSGRMQIQRIDRGVSVLRDQFAASLQLLMAGVALVLLMVCSNVAGLLLERATARERETAVRIAVGASQVRLMRQWLTESLSLALLGGLFGVGIAWLATPVLGSMIPPLRNRSGELLTLDPNIGLNWRVLSISFAACVVAALAAGFAPAWRAGRHDLGVSLRTSRSSSRVEGGITVFQIALCTLLLIEAGLFGRTLASMRSMDVGFDRDHVVAFTIVRDHARLDAKMGFRETLLSEAQQLPGVRGVAFARLGVLRGTGMKTSVGMPGERVPPSEFMNSSLNAVSPEYFDTMGIRIVSGRGLARTDRSGNLGVEGPKDPGPTQVVVNQALARRFFPGQDPIGKIFGTGAGILKATHQIVGVASDSQYRSLREPVPPTFYSNVLAEEGDPITILHVRASGDPAALINPVRDLLRKLAPGWSIREINLLRDETERSIWRERLVAQLTIGFAVVAGLLATIGLYGTLAYYVSRNRRGIGIRVAIGAARSNIVELIAGRVARLIAAGAVLGLVASFILAGWVRRLLFGVGPSDPLSIGIALSVLVSIALIALLLPAWGATRIDPGVTLREE